jgi:SnoaL-like domain
MSSANIAFVQSLYAAFGRGDIATIINGLASDVDWSVNGRRKDYPLLGSWKGPIEVQRFFQGVAEHEEATDFSPREFFAADDRVCVLGTMPGRSARPAAPSRATGCTFSRSATARSSSSGSSTTPPSSPKPIAAEFVYWRVSGPLTFFHASMPP